MPASNPSTPPVLPTYGNSAGMIPVSGIAPSGGNYPGPHFVETQSMDIKYIRVPNYLPVSKSFSLSTIPVTWTITSTYILPIIEASYKVVRDMNTYSTSGYQQNQKFAVIPEGTDPYGNSYDSTNGLGASALGPMGRIVSQYVWYYRRPWVDGVDEEFSKSATGSTWYTATPRYAEGGGAANCFDENGKFWFPTTPSPANWSNAQDFSKRVHGAYDTMPTILSWTASYPVPRETGFLSYSLQGPYDPNNESPEHIQGWVDRIADDVSWKRLYGLGGDFETVDNPLLGPDCPPLAATSEGLFKYSVLRHDWS